MGGDALSVTTALEYYTSRETWELLKKLANVFVRPLDLAADVCKLDVCVDYGR